MRKVLCLLRGRLEIDVERDRLLIKHMCKEMERIGKKAPGNNNKNNNAFVAGGQNINGKCPNDEDFYVTFHEVLTYEKLFLEVLY